MNFPHFLDLKDHYRFHNNPSLVPILNQMNSVHTLPAYFSRIRFKIIIQCTPRSSKWPLTFRFSPPKFLCISHVSHACYIPYSSHPPWFHQPNNIGWSFSLCSVLQSPNIPLSTLFSPTLRLCSCLQHWIETHHLSHLSRERWTIQQYHNISKWSIFIRCHNKFS